MFSTQSDNVSPFVHIFDIISFFPAELEESKIAISGKGLINALAWSICVFQLGIFHVTSTTITAGTISGLTPIITGYEDSMGHLLLKQGRQKITLPATVKHDLVGCIGGLTPL